MKKASLIVLTAAALFAAGAAGAAEQANPPAAQPAHPPAPKSSTAVQTCKDQGKTGKELNDCVREERKKEREARHEAQAADKQHASAAPTEGAQPIK
ncbi:MAG TPA: hypothetical protein VFX30_04975 [bacterium]|nr:hypothetical protein [bacterium]